jgi:hypothetical protein
VVIFKFKPATHSESAAHFIEGFWNLGVEMGRLAALLMDSKIDREGIVRSSLGIDVPEFCEYKGTSLPASKMSVLRLHHMTRAM